MGASLYERYLAEQEPPKGGGLYEQYLKSQKKADPMAELFKEQGLLERPEPVALDVNIPSESTGVLTPKKRDAIARQPHNLGEWAKEGAAATATAAASLPIVAAQAVPGMELAQAGARSLVRREPYSEALKDIRGVTDEVPASMKMAAQAPLLLATARGATMIPKVGKALRSPALSGGGIGAADQALSADEMSLEDRLARTAAGGVIGATAGKSLDMLVTGARTIPAKNVSKNVTLREDAMNAADDVAYGAAARQGSQAGGSSPELAAALKHPKVAKYTDQVRDTEAFKNATDAEVGAEVYKLLSRAERRVKRVLANADDYAADEELAEGELKALKQILLGGTDKIMPSFRGAARQHAKAEGGIEAVETGAGAMSRAGYKVNPKNAGRLGQEAYGRKFDNMSLEERLAAQEGVLGELGEQMGLRPNIISGGGILSSADRLRRAGPILRRIDTKGQRTLDDLIRASLLGTATRVP